MKNYAYIIFFDHFITAGTFSIHTETVTSRLVTHPQSGTFSIHTKTVTSRLVTHPQSAPGLARLTSEFHLHELPLHLL
jgi:hypothetical protein